MARKMMPGSDLIVQRIYHGSSTCCDDCMCREVIQDGQSAVVVLHPVTGKPVGWYCSFNCSSNTVELARRVENQLFAEVFDPSAMEQSQFVQ